MMLFDFVRSLLNSLSLYSYANVRTSNNFRIAAK
jgi:hypothetical protein